MLFNSVCLMYLLLITVTDIKTYRIPDTMISAFTATMVFAFLDNIPFQNYICGIVFFLVLNLISHVTKGIGGGDVKLIGALGTVCGFYTTAVTLFFACIFGIVFALVSGRKSRIPFAPFITAGYSVQELLKVF